MAGKNSSLNQFLNGIKKKYETKIIEEKEKDNNFFSTGSLVLDRLIGGYGYPLQRIIEIFGQPATGKTTLTIHGMSEMQKISQKSVAFFDIERTLNLTYAKTIGVNVDRLAVFQPKNAEETFNIIIECVKSKNFSLIVVDSVAALLPEGEDVEKMETNMIGLQARIMSKALRKINHLLTENNVTLIFINQLREKIKIFFGNPETTSGGNALRFYASLRIGLRKGKKITKKEREIGTQTHVRIVKNKLGAPFKNDLISIYYGRGINWIQEVIEIGLKEKILKKQGSWVWYNEERLACGVENTRKFLEKEPELLSKIQKKIKELLKNK